MAWGFPRGLLLPSFKEPAASTGIALFQQIQRVYLPLSYSGQPRSCLFEVGDPVRQGDLLTLPEEDELLPVKSSVEGVFDGLKQLSHPLYGALTCAVIRPAIMPTPRPEAEKVVSPTPAQVPGGRQSGGDH